MTGLLDRLAVFLLLNPLAWVAIVAGWCGAMALLTLIARRNLKETL